MTYYSGATTQTYEFTAFSEVDLQNAGVSGSVSCGDSFTMPASASLCFKVEDNDARLSGDGKRWSNDKASDNSYQTAEISTGADGPDIGNGGQIYAEKYFWVCDEDGNWYVLIEIEQEGSTENHYTFHTDYGIPPADAVLTVSAPCNIGRSGVKFDDLGAGDCAPTPPQNDDCITIEAEDMHLWGYDVQYLDGASGGKVVKADYCAPASYAKTQFNGADGTYDLKLTVLDEADGQGEINIYINGVLVSSVVLDEDSGGIYGETGVFREIVLDDIELKAGDKITIEGVRDGCEFARIDKLEICKDDKPLPAALGDQVWLDENRNGIQDSTESGVAGVTVELKDASGNVIATTTTDANGNYLFSGLAPGDYSVAFVLPDGFEFTAQDVGDDSTDSDADPTTGMTGIYSLEAGETDLSADAGLVRANVAPEAMDDMGKLCATDSVALDVLGNDSDPDGDGILVARIEGVDVGVGSSVTLGSGAVVTLNADGTLNYDSSAASYTVGGVAVAASDLLINTQATDSFTYSVSDGVDFSTATVDVTICGAKNTLETIAASLPSGGQAVLSVGDASEFFTVDLSGTGDASLDGTYGIAYCVAAEVPITPGTSYDVTLEVLDETAPIAITENIGIINWILNQDFTSVDNGDGTGTTYTEGEIQGAIWGFTDGFDFIDDVPDVFGTDENSVEIYQAALDAGAAAEDFVPDQGDVLAILLATDDPSVVQPLIIGVEFDSLAQDCVCV